MSNVFNIPSDVASVVLSSWVSLFELALLDSALCNKKFRIEYINLITADAIKFKGYKGKVGNNFLVWLKLRGISVDFINLNGRDVLDYQLLQSRNYLRHKLTVCKIGSFDESVAQVLGKFTFKYTTLQSLFLRDAPNLTDAIVFEITQNCPNLMLIDITKCEKITSDSVQYIIEHCVDIESLTITKCKLSHFPAANSASKLPIRFNRLRKLTHLNVSSNDEIDDSCLTYILANTGSLTSVNMAGCRLSDDTLAFLANNCGNTLLDCNMRGCAVFTEEGIRQFLTRCSQLRTVDIRNCRVSDDVMRCLMECCKNIQELSYDNEWLHWRVSPQMLMTIITHFGPQLTLLCGSAENFTDEFFATIGKVCKKLKHFVLLRETAAVKLTDDGIVEMAKGCSQLEVFGLEKHAFTCLTDKCIIEGLAKYCPALREVKIVGADQLTSDSVKALARSCKKLQQLHLYDSVLVDDEALSALSESCLDITSLAISSFSLTDVTLLALTRGCFPQLSKLYWKTCLKRDQKWTNEVFRQLGSAKFELMSYPPRPF